jgi:hypothetical protein
MKVGDPVQLTQDVRYLFTSYPKGSKGVIRKTSSWGGLHTLRMADGRTVFARTDEIDPAPQPARTGPEFAKAHHNDSIDWMPADFDTVICLAEMDVQPAWKLLNRKPKTTTPAADLQPAA